MLLENNEKNVVNNHINTHKMLIYTVNYVCNKYQEWLSSFNLIHVKIREDLYTQGF